MSLAVAALGLAIWLYLVFARGGFWLALERESSGEPLRAWPEAVAVIPARDEAETIGATIRSLLAQDYRGLFSIVVVDDESADATAEIARRAGSGTGQLSVIAGKPTPPGWTGKLWAAHQGVAEASAQATYLLLTDADIVYAPGALTQLVARAEAEGLALNSLMARLACESAPERFAIPAFVYFFQMLYPFAWVGDVGAGTAAAAGGCMLVRREAFEAVGGLARVRGALIDDCALARVLKAQGPIRLGLADHVSSLRRYAHIGEIRRMVVRSAYAQLDYSPAWLAFALVAMALVFLSPPLAALFAHGTARACGVGGWLLMAVSFQPTLRDYRQSPWWGFALPAIAMFYAVCTLQSGLASARGTGGLWKGRYQEGTARRRSTKSHGM